MIFFGTGGCRSPCSRTTRTATVAEVRLHSQQGDDATHDVEISDRQGPHGLSRSTIYLRISRGTFPAPVSLGGRAVGWIEAEVNAWLTDRVAQRRLIRARGAATPATTRLRMAGRR